MLSLSSRVLASPCSGSSQVGPTATKGLSKRVALFLVGKPSKITSCIYPSPILGAIVLFTDVGRSNKSGAEHFDFSNSNKRVDNN